MQVRRIGQPEPRLHPRGGRQFGAGPIGPQQRDLAARLRLARGAELARRTGPFLEDTGRPQRGEMAQPGRAQQHLAHHRGVEHAGIEDDLHSR